MTVPPDSPLCGYCNKNAQMSDPLMWKDPKRCLHCDLLLCPDHIADDLEHIMIGNLFACCTECNKKPHHVFYEGSSDNMADVLWRIKH